MATSTTLNVRILDDNVLVTIVAEANSGRPAAQFAGMLLDMMNKEGGFEDAHTG